MATDHPLRCREKLGSTPAWIGDIDHDHNPWQAEIDPEHGCLMLDQLMGAIQRTMQQLK